MANNILITGLPNVGKTTLIDKIMDKLQVKADGFITFEKRKNGKRTGFYIQDFSGNRMTMADVNFDSPFQVAKYGVDFEAFEKIGIPAMKSAREDTDIVIIDEIGTMETFSEKFCQELVTTFDSPKPLLATIKKRNSPFINNLKNRDDTTIFSINKGNRNQIIEPILQKIRKIL